MDKDKCGAAAKADNPDLACHPEMRIAYPWAVKSQLTPYFSPIMILYRSLHDGGVMDFSSLHASMGTDTPIEYEIFNGGDPHNDLKFGPVFKDFAKQAFGDRYEAEVALAMFSMGNFESVWQVACSVSIANAQQMDGLVFWASGGVVAMIPKMFQSTFTHCPTDHESGLIDKWLVDVLNMAKQMPFHPHHSFTSMVPSASTVPSASMVPSASAISSASMISLASTVPLTSGVPSTSANAPFKSRTAMGANFITRFAQAALDQDVNWSQDVDSGLEFVTPSDSEDSNNEHFDDVFSKEDENGNQCQKPRTKSNHPHIPNIEAELANLEAQEGIWDDQLHDNNNSTADILPNISTLKDGPLSLDQWKMCELIWGQFMKAVDFLAQKWQVKPSRILAKAGHVVSEKDNWPTDGLNKNEAAAKKDSLLKGLQEKRGIRDFEQAEEGRQGAIMARNANSIKKQACRPVIDALTVWAPSLIQTARLPDRLRLRKHLTHSRLIFLRHSTMPYELQKPHGISILNSQDGAKWAFPMKQLGLKLCVKELTLVGWPDDL
ncbi:hypothetical protein BS47DRAFT_1366224 [Hydnum rufescens UP504]|uniref:Uncharacterized protein n=1 Tax=Hydnum rufescens UP504 TaxID=1448309 RepID=A0A9P6AMD5_9AGAM|nr:hypothetical protein BS47DRAFT_1366224 [Hydnum rufescens UP504]